MKHLFIIGAQRAGTTYLYHLLQNHPQVTMAQPVRPEPKFFLDNDLFHLGRTYYEKKYFGTRSTETRCLGEKSTSYIESTLAAERIAKFYPDARILVVLRNPVFRAYSNYLFSLQHGLEQLSFEQAITAESKRLREATYNTSVNPFAYRQRGYYIDYIEKYLKIYSRKQLGILIFEELVDNLAEFQALYRWLGIDDTFIPDVIHQTYNPAELQKEDQTPVFRNLAIDYKDSLERLEKFLGRKIDVWRNHWNGLLP